MKMGLLDDPNQIVLVTSRYGDEDNVMAAAWWTKTSFKPELYLISIAKTRHSHNIIKESKSFVINFMPFELKDKILYCGIKSGKDIDKFRECGFDKIQAEKINCSIIKQALAYIECKVVKTVETGDHTLFIGKAVNTKIVKEGKRALQLNKIVTTTID